MMIHSSPPTPQEGESPGQRSTWSDSRVIGAFVVISLVVLGAFVFASPYPPGTTNGNYFSRLMSSLGNGQSTGTTTGTQTYTLSNPTIQGGSANISYPAEYDTLASFALDQINTDRSNFSGKSITVPADSALLPVSLSPSKVAQQHADSMLRYAYFSHYDTQGYKPYMRYSLLGGTGAVEENVAFVFQSPGIFTSTSSVETVIQEVEHAMMFNDSACCNNGHRDNILTAIHNKVSIGVAYNTTYVYFVEDFENNYIDLNFSVSNLNTVTMTGSVLKSGINPVAIFIAYDQTPAPLSPTQLNNGPREYGPGAIIGGILPYCDASNPLNSCESFSQGITVYANPWVFNSTNVDIVFSLSKFIQHSGTGAYTVYLVTGTDTSSAITSISVFVSA